MSGIALQLLAEEIHRKGSRPNAVLIHPTRAAMLQALYDLGPRPPWWRPLARRRWRALREVIIEIFVRSPGGRMVEVS